MDAFLPILAMLALLVQGKSVEGQEVPGWATATATATATSRRSTTNPTGKLYITN
jgi:hypothetical protein